MDISAAFKKWVTRKAKEVSALAGYQLQDTAFGCNGDLYATENTVIAVSHTNPKWTKPDKSWKENRVEFAKKIPTDGNYLWRFKASFRKLPQTSDWVIFSQHWNRENDNVLSLVVFKSTKYEGKVLIRLDKKFQKKTTTLWKKYFDQHIEHDFNLLVTRDGVKGLINEESVGEHSVAVYSNKHHQEVKYGMYWSGNIPYNQDNHMIIEYKF